MLKVIQTSILILASFIITFPVDVNFGRHCGIIPFIQTLDYRFTINRKYINENKNFHNLSIYSAF